METKDVMVHGAITCALTHLAQIGLARVLDGRIGWTDEQSPRAFVRVNLPDEQVSDRLQVWSHRHKRADDWTQESGNQFLPAALGNRFGIKKLVDRVGPGANGWRWELAYERARDVIDACDVAIIALPRTPDLAFCEAVRAGIVTQVVTVSDRGKAAPVGRVDRQADGTFAYQRVKGWRGDDRSVRRVE